MKITSLAELQALRDKERIKLGIRSGVQLQSKRRVVVSMGTCGIAAGARAILTQFVDAVAEKDLFDSVVVEQSTCVGSYGFEPMVTVYDLDGTESVYVNVTKEKTDQIIEQHLLGGKAVSELLKP